MRRHRESHRQRADELAVYLNQDAIARGTHGGSAEKRNTLHGFRYPAKHGKRQQLEITQSIKRRNQTDFKVGLIESRAGRYGEVAAVARSFAQSSKCGGMPHTVDFENKGLGRQRAKFSIPAYQNAAFPTRFFNPGRTRSTIAASIPIPAIRRKWRCSDVLSIVTRATWARVTFPPAITSASRSNCRGSLSSLSKDVRRSTRPNGKTHPGSYQPLQRFVDCPVAP